MNKIQIFRNEQFGEIRTIIINNEPWFVGKDVAERLGYKDTSDALRTHVDEEDKGVGEIPTPGGNQNMIAINESGLYSLTLSSKLPKAKEFKRWVTKEVIPSVRKHGAYMTTETIEKALTDPDFLIELATKLKEEKQARIKAERKNAVLMHVLKTYTTTEIAKELGLKSAIALNKKLAEKGIQFKQNNTWVLYSKYADKGYTEIKQTVLDSGKIVYDRKWTQSGRDFIINLIGW